MPRFPLLLACAGLAAAPVPLAAAADETSLEARLAEKAPAIVTIKVVLRAGEREGTREIRGVVVDPSGLVLASASSLAPGNRSPVRMHVIVGDDPKENPAVLVARDSALGLAYLQVLDAKDLASVDLSKGAAARVGQDLFGVSRSERTFDFTPKVSRLYVTGRLEKPRPLWDFAGDFFETGLPVFDLSGAPVGVLVDQAAPSGVDSEGEESEIFILPVDAVARSLDAARKRVPDAVARAKKEPEAKPAADAPGGEDGDEGDAEPGEEAPSDGARPETPPPPAPGGGEGGGK
jgi:S1-C subfamily serine protease